MFVENEYIEFKRELTKEIKKEIVAFANSKGGTIFIGVDDDGKAVGLKNISKDMEALSGMIHEGIKSYLTPYTTIRPIKKDDKDIIELIVASAPNKPYYLADKGLKSSGVFVRHGNTSVPLSEEAIKQMIIEYRDPFETNVSYIQDLHFTYLTKVFEEHGLKLDKRKYKTLNLMDNNNYYTNLGLLVSDECPYTIKCAIFQGNNRSIFKDRKEFTGSIFKQIDEALHYLNLVNRIRAEIVGFKRVDTKDYPDFAIRESLFNAFIHRSYDYSGSIIVSVFDNRIEFVSLGDLVLGLTIYDITHGISHQRNKDLANLFYRLDYVESFGTGIERMIEEYEKFNLKPTFEAYGGSFKVILPNVNYKEETKDVEIVVPIKKLSQEEKVVRYLEENEKITRQEVELLLNIAKSRSKELMQSMVRNKIILKQGTGKNIYYILNKR